MSDHYLQTVNESGFPLQIAIENLIRSQQPGEWRVRYVEHAWRSEDRSQSGFIDLVIQNPWDTAVMVIECKRVRDSHWIFLTSDGKVNSSRTGKAWITRYAEERYKFFGWESVSTDPACPQAVFCVVRGQAANGSRPMLERVASEVVSSTEALAFQEKELRARKYGDCIRAYFSVIVSTAKLMAGNFDPSDAHIADGILGSGSFSEVPYVRFRKQLVDHAPAFTVDDYANRDLAATRESTVFVVNSEHVAAFLSNFQLDNRSFNRFI